MNIRKILSVAAFCACSALLFPAAPACLAAEKSVPAKSENAWEKIFPAGIMRAGKKSRTASTKNLAALEGKFVGVYHSASWCGPCRKFTPVLVDFYGDNKDKLEIVFESADRSEDAMLAYISADKMKWFASPFGKATNVTRSGRGIPNLLVYTPDGEKFAEIIGASSVPARLEELKKRMDAWFAERAK